MKQVSYRRKYSLSASRAHQSHLQFSFVVGNAFCPCRYLTIVENWGVDFQTELSPLSSKMGL